LKGYVINKFRGDPSLFIPALDIIAFHTGLICLGVIPWFAQASLLPPEDSASLRNQNKQGAIKVVIPRLSRLANFDDFDPLVAEDDVSVDFVEPGRALPGDADLVILPGSKATIPDLDFLKAQGWDIDITAHLRRGGKVLGICAGYQMLGRSVSDPLGVESPEGSVISGLGLLAVDTVMAGDKVLRSVSGNDSAGHAVHGYEMHMGRSQGEDCARPFLMLDGHPDGAISADGRVMGCYLHGLFASDDFRSALLAGLRQGRQSDLAYEAQVDRVLDELAQHLESHVDMDALLGFLK